MLRPSPAQRGRSGWSWSGAAVVGVLGAAAATLVLPGAAGLSGHWPWTALIAFRGLLMLTAATAAAILGLASLVVRRWRRLHTALLALTVLAAAAGAGELLVLTVRGLTSVRPTTGLSRPGDLTVVVANTDVSRADPAGLARLFVASDADVMAMPETDAALAGEVASRLVAAGRPVQVFGVAGQGSILPTSLLVWTGLGPYRQVGGDGRGFGAVVADPVGGPGDRPVLVAVHPMAPLGREFLPEWRRGTVGAAALCQDTSDIVVAGDFNSTLDHPAFRSLGRCFDAARQAGSAGVATWPSWAPQLFGAPLDHVIATDTHWRAAAAWVEPIVGSDHRSLVTRLVPAQGDTATAGSSAVRDAPRRGRFIEALSATCCADHAAGTIV